MTKNQKSAAINFWVGFGLIFLMFYIAHALDGWYEWPILLFIGWESLMSFARFWLRVMEESE